MVDDMGKTKYMFPIYMNMMNYIRRLNSYIKPESTIVLSLYDESPIIIAVLQS